MYGASRSFLRLTARSVANGITVKAVLPKSGPLVDALREAGVEVLILNPFPLIERFAFKTPAGLIALLFNTPVSVRKICRLIKDFRPDIVHTNISIAFTPAVATRLTKTRHIWHIRETYVEFGFFWKIFRRFMVWGADRIIAISESVAEQFDEYGREKVRVIHNGYPQEEFVPVPESEIAAYKKRFDLAEDDAVIGLVGRIKYLRKGQEYLVQAAAILKDEFPHAKYLIIGSPFPGNEDHLERLNALISSLGLEKTVIYTGDAEEVKVAYAALDISIMGSCLPEPLGGVTIESMAMCKPVVGTNIGGTVEIVEDEVTGLLIPPKDPEAMASAIRRLLVNPDLREEMGRAGRARYEQFFEFDAFYNKLVGIYQEVRK